MGLQGEPPVTLWKCPFYQLSQRLDLHVLSVSWGCWNEAPQTGQLTPKTCILSWS